MILLASFLTLIAVASAGTKGRVKNGVYISPKNNFQVRVPPLLRPGAKIQDGPAPHDGFMVLFADDQCRGYFASEHRPDPQDSSSIEDYVDRNFAGNIIPPGGTLLERTTVQLRYGPAVMLRYRAPGGDPCVTVEISNGKRVDQRHDAEVGMYIFYSNGFRYALIYVLGDDPAMNGFPGVNRAPLHERLTDFVDGFEANAPTRK